MQAWIPVVSSSLYFWKSVFSFRVDSILKWRVYIKLKVSWLRAFLWCMSQTSRDRVNSRRVRTHEKNSGDAVRRLGTIIQSIFCAQSGASIRLTVWKWSGESRYLGVFPSVLENLRRAFSSGPTDPHPPPPPGIRGCNQGNKKLLCSLCTFCARTMHSAPWPSRPHVMHISWKNKSIPTIGPFIREKISRGLHKTRKEPFIRVRLILDANCSYKWFTA